MKNMKFWRTALVATLVLTIMLSVTGGTIAWFTDSVESGANVIKAGNLDVELYRSTTNVPEEKVTTSTKLFTVPTLWEPGAVAYENLKVANEGNLHLYFDLGINFSNVNTVKDTEYGLDDVLKVAVVEGGVSGDREDMLAAAQAAGGKTLGSLVEKQSLAPDASKTYGVVIYWEPSANDNNWNLNNGKETSNGVDYLTIDLGVKLEATQFNYEPDSFGPDYDSNAKVTVYDEAGLKTALEEDGMVILGNDIEVAEYLTIAAGKNVVLDLNGQTLSKSNDEGLIIKNHGNLALTGDGVIDGTMGNYAVRNETGSELTVDDGVVIDGGFGAISSFGAKLTINGGDFSNEESNTTHYVVYATNNSTVVINGGSFTFGADQYAGSNGSPILAATNGSTIEINGGIFAAEGGSALCYNANNIVIKGGTFKNRATATYSGTIEGKVPSGYKIEKVDGTWTVSRNAQNVEATTDKVANTAALTDAINAATAERPYINLGAGEYKMPSSSTSNEITIVGTKDTVIDVSKGAYVDSGSVAFEGVTIKTSTGYVMDENGNQGSDYAALYTPNATYTNCTFVGPMRIGRDGAKFINCTFTELGNDYVWTYGNDCEFIGCTFNTDGKAILIYSDGGNEVSKVTVKDCVFNSTTGAKASAIANQNCAAIEIHNYGNGVNLTTSGNTYDSNFSGEWRIKTYEAGKPDVIVNGTEYTKTALDGKLMTVTNSEATYD